MRIGFTGAQGTGKTTTAEALKPHLPGFYFPPSSARNFTSVGINTEANPLSQILITIDRVTNIARHDQVCTDRVAVDSWAYTEYQLMNTWRPEDIPDGYVSITNMYVDAAMAQIDWLFYFPPYWAPTEDGIRSPDRKYQRDIDDLIRHGIKRFYPDLDRMIIMPNDTVEERVQLILETIKLDKR